MQFPFLPVATLAEGGVVGQTFAIYENRILTNSYQEVETITIMPGGNTSQGWHWMVDGGILYLTDDTGVLQFQFNGVELVNGRLNAVGTKVGNGTVSRVVMHETVPLGNDWTVRVSSCPSNSSALDELLKTLNREKVPKSKIQVVVGSVPYREGYKKKVNGIQHISDTRNLRGFTGLLADREGSRIKEDMRYVLLHDTCKVTEGFNEWMSNVDVGLNPDVILFRPLSEGVELGVYSGSFLLKQTDLDVIDQKQRLETLVGRAEIVLVVGGNSFTNEPTRLYDEKKMRQGIVMCKPHVTKMKSVNRRKGNR